MNGIGRAGACALCVLISAAAAGAHSPTAEQAIAEIHGIEAREPVGVVEVAQSPELERMLVVRVGAGWDRSPAERRRDHAERWWRSWRHVMANGIVAVVDHDTQLSRVSYDRQGRARLKAPGPTRKSPGGD